MNNLGTYIQEVRKLAGFDTQKAFADALGKDQAWVSRLERGVGKETPPPEDIYLLASVLKVSQQELLIAAGYKLEDTPPPDAPAVRAVRAILDAQEFSDDELRALTSHIRSAVELIKGKY